MKRKQHLENQLARHRRAWPRLPLLVALAGAVLGAVLCHRDDTSQVADAGDASRAGVERASEKTSTESRSESLHVLQVRADQKPAAMAAPATEQPVEDSLDSAAAAFEGGELAPNGPAIQEWTLREPKAAAEWALSLPEGPQRTAALEQVAVSWANADLPGAVEWLAALPEEAREAGLALTVGYEAARTDPQGALNVLSSLEPSPERDDALEHALSQWAESDASAAAAWVLRIPDADLKNRLVSAAAIACADQNGQAAAQLASEALTSPEEQNRASVAIVQRWAQTDPQAASEWVALFPEGAARDAAVENLFAIWGAQDRAAAEREAAKLPAALSEIASAALQTAPEQL